MQNLSKNQFLGVHKGVPPHAGNAKPQYSMYVAFTCFDTTAFGNTIGRLIAISKKHLQKLEFIFYVQGLDILCICFFFNFWRCFMIAAGPNSIFYVGGHDYKWNGKRKKHIHYIWMNLWYTYMYEMAKGKTFSMTFSCDTWHWEVGSFPVQKVPAKRWKSIGHVEILRNVGQSWIVGGLSTVSLWDSHFTEVQWYLYSNEHETREKQWHSYISYSSSMRI